MVAAAVERFGRVDCLVNNAAGNFVVKGEDLSPNGWRAVVSIVLDGGFLCTRAAGRRMIAQGSGGAVLSVIASYAWTGGPGTVHSASAKAGLLAMTKTLAVEWAPHGIRLNTICPGPTDTEGAGQALWPDAADRARVERSVPAGQAGNGRGDRLVVDGAVLGLRLLRDRDELHDRRRALARTGQLHAVAETARLGHKGVTRVTTVPGTCVPPLAAVVVCPGQNASRGRNDGAGHRRTTCAGWGTRL